MAKPFRLATLLRLRERDRDHAAKAVQEVHMAIGKLNDAEAEIRQINADMDAVRKDASHGMIAIRQILDAQRYQLILEAQAAEIADHQGKLQQELERRQHQLVRAQQSVKSLEKLRDQRAKAEDTLALAKQQERLDEWASVRYSMSVRPSLEAPE